MFKLVPRQAVPLELRGASFVLEPRHARIAEVAEKSTCFSQRGGVWVSQVLFYGICSAMHALAYVKKVCSKLHALALYCKAPSFLS